jgi:ribosomal protein S12 methylthiotransferase accessory factor
VLLDHRFLKYTTPFVKSATFFGVVHPKDGNKKITLCNKEHQFNMEMIIDFPGGSRVDAHFGGFTIPTDQPPAASAPTPFATFLSSIGTCAGIYVLGFCRQRGIPTDGIRIVQRINSNPLTHMVDKIDLEIQVPPAFPDKYRDSLIRSAELCAVKKHLENPPVFDITTTRVELV